MAISREEIEELTTLARITVSADELDSIEGDLDSILGFVAQIQDVDVSAVDEINTDTARINVMRHDTLPHERGLYTEALLDNAPKTHNEYIVVKKIIDNT